MKISSAQVVETPVPVNDIPVRDYTHPDDHIPSAYDTIPGVQRIHGVFILS